VETKTYVVETFMLLIDKHINNFRILIRLYWSSSTSKWNMYISVCTRAFSISLRFHSFALCDWMLVRMNLWLQFAWTYGCGFIPCNCFIKNPIPQCKAWKTTLQIALASWINIWCL